MSTIPRSSYKPLLVNWEKLPNIFKVVSFFFPYSQELFALKEM
jgi:hypothetical protein